MNDAAGMMSPGRWRVSRKVALLPALVLLSTAMLAYASSPALGAEPGKFFNAEHSLMGNCKTSKADPIIDPGCPSDIPPTSLESPSIAAVGPRGETYVYSYSFTSSGVPNHIDVFAADGKFVARFKDEELGSIDLQGIAGIAVDSDGRLYVAYGNSEGYVVRFDPSVYDPNAGEIAYEMPGVVVVDPSNLPASTGDIAVDPVDDHLYVRFENPSRIAEFGAATDGMPNQMLTDKIGKGYLAVGQSPEGRIALDHADHRIYAFDWKAEVKNPPPGTEETVISVFGDEAPYPLLMKIDGSTRPEGKFAGGYPWTYNGLAVDESTGRLYVADRTLNKLFELEPDGGYVATLSKPSLELPRVRIAIDNFGGSPNQGYLYVPSGVAVGHLFAYEPLTVPVPPVVGGTGATGVTTDEAVLKATVNPKSEPAHWVLEYVSEQQYDEEGGFAGAAVAGEGDVSPGNRAVAVSAPVNGLTPATAYRFRVRAENMCEPTGCEDEEEAAFSTFSPAPPTNTSCPNQAFRTGASGTLPDCRAYELVSPRDTAGFAPNSIGKPPGPDFVTPAASYAGDSVAFSIVGSLIPGFEGGAGHLEGDTYVVRRGSSGWATQILGPDATQATIPHPGGLSADHRYLAVGTSGEGTLVHPETGIDASGYTRYPDGSFRLTGEGSLASTPNTFTSFISDDGSHIIFQTWRGAPQLEPLAPPDGTEALYDRTADGIVDVVSLLPGEVTPAAGQHAQMLGASADGSTVAFAFSGDPQIYVRVDNSKTLVVGTSQAQFAGISDDGRYLFYLEDGDLYRLDTGSEVIDPFTESGDVDPVNIGSEGIGGYFLSPSVLVAAPNPLGAEPQPGAQNLYHWGNGGDLAFVATVTDRDAKGQTIGEGGGSKVVDGLGLLVNTERNGWSQITLASRTSNDGSVLLFESRANITGFDSGGKAEIFRFDAAAETLQCVSCDPTGTAKPSGDASVSPPFGESELFGAYVEIPTLTGDGDRAFFETPERLVAADNDGLVDVYEWEANGAGSCAHPDGCLFLISSGQSTRDNRIFGVSRNGDDVFILTSDLLGGGDTDATPSIYDARVGGGFAPPAVPPAECLGEACQPAAEPPLDATPNSASYHGQGNAVVKQPRACPKGKHKVRQGGKTRCVRNRHHRNRAHAKGRTHR